MLSDQLDRARAHNIHTQELGICSLLVLIDPVWWMVGRGRETKEQLVARLTWWAFMNRLYGMIAVMVTTASAAAVDGRNALDILIILLLILSAYNH